MEYIFNAELHVILMSRSYAKTKNQPTCLCMNPTTILTQSPTYCRPHMDEMPNPIKQIPISQYRNPTPNSHCNISHRPHWYDMPYMYTCTSI